jgi:hypothetical protein
MNVVCVSESMIWMPLYCYIEVQGMVHGMKEMAINKHGTVNKDFSAAGHFVCRSAERSRILPHVVC